MALLRCAALIALLAAPHAASAQLWSNGGGLSTGASTSASSSASTSSSTTVIAPSASPSAGIVPIVSTALESSHVMKASGGNLYSGYVAVSAAASGYFMIFDAPAPPASGSVAPRHCLPVPAGSYAGVHYGGAPETYLAGITFAFSTADCVHFAPSPSAWFHGDVQ